MDRDLSKCMAVIAASLNVKLYLNDRFVSFEEVFSDTGLLPAFSKRADQLCSLCLGYGLGATYDEAEGALLGIRVIFDEVTPNVLRLLCMVIKPCCSKTCDTCFPFFSLLYPGKVFK